MVTQRNTDQLTKDFNLVWIYPGNMIALFLVFCAFLFDIYPQLFSLDQYKSKNKILWFWKCKNNLKRKKINKNLIWVIKFNFSLTYFDIFRKSVYWRRENRIIRKKIKVFVLQKLTIHGIKTFSHWTFLKRVKKFLNWKILDTKQEKRSKEKFLIN
jgi:hypothetical protein